MESLILHPIQLEKLAKEWLLEDTSNFDVGGAVIGDNVTSLSVLFKSPGMIAGIPFANAICAQFGLETEWNNNDGDVILNPVRNVGTITGAANHLLLAERIVLNVMCRASGISTTAWELSQKLKDIGWHGTLAGTRKTTPGFRLVEKYALVIGGADPHRYDLSSLVMLKDNHISICGSITKAVKKARKFSSFCQKIEVECSTLPQALEAGNAGCDIIMLDNFKADDLQKSAEIIKQQFPKILIEASGGITSSNIQNYASPSVDVISTSSLVQGYKTLDISMKVSS